MIKYLFEARGRRCSGRRFSQIFLPAERFWHRGRKQNADQSDTEQVKKV